MNNRMHYNLNNGNIKIIAFCILQKILFEYNYRNIIFPLFQYYGFQNQFDISRYVLSWILYAPVPLFTISCVQRETLSRQAVAFLLDIIYTPCLILYAFTNSTPFIMWLVVYYLVMILAVNCMNPVRFRIRFGRINSIENIMMGAGYILGLVVIFVWAYYAHFRVQFNLSDVYTARMAAREFSTPRIITYMRAMARGVIPLLVIYSIYKRSVGNIVFFTMVQIVQFFIDGSKTVVFVLALGVLAYFFIEKHNRIVDKIPVILSIGAGLAILEKIFICTSFLANAIFRRVMFLPALQNYQYYELAKENGLDYYRQSLSLLGESRYNQVIARIIGLRYYGSEAANANNGLFADAYVNLGAFGCVLMPILIVLIFKLIEGAGERLPKSVWAVCVIQAFFSFTSSSFFTVLITHGVLLMILELYNLSPQNDKNG